MISSRHRTAINVFLLGFAVWDSILAAICLFLPDTWFHMIHGTSYVDPQALLRRTGAVWAGFGLFHLLAFIKWRAQPYWLVIVGGMRLSEIFADLTYLFLAQNITVNGRLGLLLATPSNIFFSLFFIRSFLLLARSEKAATP